MFSGLGLKPPASSFQSYSYSSPLLHPYSTDDKTSRLMVKRFCTVRDTQGGSQREEERREKREEGDWGDWEEKGEIKRGESNLACKQFPMCPPQSGTLREVHRVTWRREEGGRR